MATKWLQSSPCAPLPANAVKGGYDSDGSVIYVGRSYHEGKHLPVKVIPSKKCAYISWAGVEHSKSHYELLIGGENYTWQPCCEANIPPNAIRTGETVSGSEPVFIGRGFYDSSLVVGRIQPSHACLYIPYAGQEIKLNKYEILVYGAAVDGENPDQEDLIGLEDHKWVYSSAYANLPPNAVVGGNDVDGDTLYVGRAFHEDNMLVAKVIPAKQIAFVSFRGAEIPKTHFETLCGHNLVWRHCYNHIIPENAVLCGKTSLDQPVYIGRGHYEGSLTIGKLSSVHKALFIPFKGVERRLETYEILVAEKLTPGWQVSLPTGPVPSAPEKPLCPYPEIKPFDPPPPCVSGATPMPMPMPIPLPHRRPVPACHYPTPVTNYPAPIPAATYPGPLQQFPSTRPPTYTPSTSQPYNRWVSVNFGSVPRNAVLAGHDIDMTQIYVCRAYHVGNFLPGKAIPRRTCAYVSYQGHEIQKNNYEMLVGEHYKWTPAINGFAVGAVEAGRTAAGEPLYAGRAQYKGSLTCGKIQRSHNCLYIPFNGHEIIISHGYEILVDRNLNNRGEAAALSY